ncbi:MAG: tyrosine-type recombinase/integrase [Polyangia bacterium]
MRDSAPLGSWVRRFLLEHLIGERNLSRNTQRSYRDSLRLVLPYVARHARVPIDRLDVEQLSPDHVRAFLRELEDQRGCGPATRNQRLAAIRSLAHFIGMHSPEHVRWCGEVRAIPFKKAPRPLVTYLDKCEMDALLAAATTATPQGRRDHALMLFLYNTGARADEAAHVLITDLHLAATPGRDSSSVLIRGKGNKLRRCPLWDATVDEVGWLVHDRRPEEHVFINRLGQPLTRFGVHAMVERCAARIAPSLAGKRVSPHTIRHTTATHLLRSGVDINTIRAWLGHVSLSTTNVYAEVDLEMKAKALATCTVDNSAPGRRKPWREDPGLMGFLRAL